MLTYQDLKNYLLMMSDSELNEAVKVHKSGQTYEVNHFSYNNGKPTLRIEKMVDIKTDNVNGSHIAYSSDSVFEVQVGKGKGSYKTKYSFTGDLKRACFYYSCINIGNGYKKRLICKTFNKPIIARHFS